jgi:protein-S-isoprenylcysteine O-methyltransferase Ste14
MSESNSRLQNIPGIRWVIRHPRISAWVVLAVGMIALLMIEARDIGLLAGQWVALVVACILVAGACVWIISWEDDEPETPDAIESK